MVDLGTIGFEPPPFEVPVFPRRPAFAGAVGFTGPFLLALAGGADFCVVDFFLPGTSSSLSAESEPTTESESVSDSISASSDSESLKSETEADSFFPFLDIAASRLILYRLTAASLEWLTLEFGG
jgi:hypothetical protein